MSKRGIYLVANEVSSSLCHNLIFTIRQCGSTLPIRIIPYGGKLLQIDPKFKDVKLLRVEDFPVEGQNFIADLWKRMPQCNPGLLNRFLSWFGEFDEFIYSDNDIVALMNWDNLFSFLADGDLVHADTEYATDGKYTVYQPRRLEQLLEVGALDCCINAGFFLCRRNPRHIGDLLAALELMEANPEMPKWHDQALLSIALAIGKWPEVNLCRPPHNWARTAANSYEPMFELFRTIQVDRQPIAFIHYSGTVPTGIRSVEELIFSDRSPEERNAKLLWGLTHKVSGLSEAKRLIKRARQKIKQRVTSTR